MPAARREISPDELSQRIRERDVIPFPVWDGKVRLSVAGYQDKLQVLVEGERIALADGPLSSTHILKPESRSPVTPCMVANEHYCMTLASRMGLPTAPVSIRWCVPRLSRCSIAPANRNVTVARLMCGWGRTSMPSPVDRCAGPIWSKKMKGPTIVRSLCGSVR